MNLPRFHEECLQIFTEHSAALAENIQNVDNNMRPYKIMWNNRHILINGKSVFYHSLFDKGIIKD